MIADSFYLKVLASSPNLDPDSTTLSTPWAPQGVSQGSTPLQPTVSIKFSHAIDPKSYATPSSWEQYFFLTSQTHPGATNITSFTNLSWDAPSCVLSFQPEGNLVAGDIYSAVLNDQLQDSAGRLISESYTWSFQVTPEGSQTIGVPDPVLISPANQVAIKNSLPVLFWGIDPGYTIADIPSGCSLSFQVSIYSDPQLNSLIWQTNIPAINITGSGSYLGLSTPGIPYTVFTCSPAIELETLVANAEYYWTVQGVLTNTLFFVTGVSNLPPANSFYLEIVDTDPQTGEVVETYPTLKQTPYASSPADFRVTGVSPQPGDTDQDIPTSNLSWKMICVAFSSTPDVPLGDYATYTTGKGVTVSGYSVLDFTPHVYGTSLLDYIGRVEVPGNWILTSQQILPPSEQPQNGPSGNCLVFIPDTGYSQNFRYSCEVPGSTSSIIGETLKETVQWGWLSNLYPFYANPYAVRQRLTELEARVSDEDLYHTIWLASLKGNRETMWYVPYILRGGPTFPQVESWAYIKTYALERFAEMETIIRLLEKLIGVAAFDSGKRESFLNTSVETNPQRIDAIKKAIKHFRPEWEEYRNEISWKKSRPVPVLKSSNYGTWNRSRDMSYNPVRRKDF